MYYFKILEIFILGVLLEKQEYNIFDKGFKPVKVFVVFVMWLNVAFTGFLIYKFIYLHEKVKVMCPQMLYDIPETPKELTKK